MNKTSFQSASLDQMKARREELRRLMVIENKKREVYYSKFYAAWRNHQRLEHEFQALDKKIFQQDPGVTVLKPHTPRAKAAPHKEVVKVPEAVKKVSDSDLMAMIEELMGAK